MKREGKRKKPAKNERVPNLDAKGGRGGGPARSELQLEGSGRHKERSKFQNKEKKKRGRGGGPLTKVGITHSAERTSRTTPTMVKREKGCKLGVQGITRNYLEEKEGRICLGDRNLRLLADLNTYLRN